MPTEASQDWRDRTTITVEEAGAVLGVGRACAYAAAGKDIPTIRVGRCLRVPVARLKALLGEVQNDNAPEANRGAVTTEDGHVVVQPSP